MKTRIVEVTNGERNWGKFLLGRFDHEWDHKSLVDVGKPLLKVRGIKPDALLILDIQTGEGGLFYPGDGFAVVQLNRHQIWVCPLFEPFLCWLWDQPDPFEVPAHVDLPHIKGIKLAGYRRKGEGKDEG